MLEKLKIYFLKFYSQYNYNTPLLQFLCYLVFCWCMKYNTRLAPNRIWLVILLITQLLPGHSRWSLLFLDTYSHPWVFPIVHVDLIVTFSPVWYVMDWLVRGVAISAYVYNEYTTQYSPGVYVFLSKIW